MNKRIKYLLTLIGISVMALSLHGCVVYPGGHGGWGGGGHHHGGGGYHGGGGRH